jgi:hypothetical protein
VHVCARFFIVIYLIYFNRYFKSFMCSVYGYGGRRVAVEVEVSWMLSLY